MGATCSEGTTQLQACAIHGKQFAIDHSQLPEVSPQVFRGLHLDVLESSQYICSLKSDNLM
jgi:hypothetical protein